MSSKRIQKGIEALRMAWWKVRLVKSEIGITVIISITVLCCILAIASTITAVQARRSAEISAGMVAEMREKYDADKITKMQALDAEMLGRLDACDRDMLKMMESYNDLLGDIILIRESNISMERERLEQLLDMAEILEDVRIRLVTMENRIKGGISYTDLRE